MFEQDTHRVIVRLEPITPLAGFRANSPAGMQSIFASFLSIGPLRRQKFTEIPMNERDHALVIVQTGGSSLKVDAIGLSDAKRVLELQKTRAEAANALGGVSTGIEFIGSPSWVLGGALALGALEFLLSSASRRQGTDKAQTAQRMTENLRSELTFFPLFAIENISEPYPSNWRAVSAAGHLYIHDGDDFVGVKTELGRMNVRWSHVTVYHGSESLFPIGPTVTAQTQPTLADLTTLPVGTTVYEGD